MVDDPFVVFKFARTHILELCKYTQREGRKSGGVNIINIGKKVIRTI